MNNKFNTLVIDPGHGGIDLGYSEGAVYEKDFNLELGKYLYEKLFDLGFPVYLTRDSDETISNYDRFLFLDNLTAENNGGTLVFSIQVNDENPDDISIIRSIKREYNANKELYDKLSNLGNVKTKTLPNDEGRDFYAIQRLTPDGSESIVIELGYNVLNNMINENLVLANNILKELVNYFGDINFVKNNYDEYIVNKGDNLYSIGKTYNISVDQLMKINNLETDFLSIGQKLKVPKLKENIYIVKKGDSLYSIAKKFDTTVDEIMSLNNLVSSKLIINQKLVIPD